MRTKVLSDRRFAQLRAMPRVYRALRSARFMVGRYLPPIAVAGIPGRVHRNDTMLEGTDPASVAAYSEVGRRTAAMVVDCATLTGHDPASASAWLDFGCGYGRVARFVAEKVPASAVSVTDVVPGAAAFCAGELGVNAIVDVESGRHSAFEVIYAISVFTHLPMELETTLLGRLYRSLAPGGALIFTTHGPSCLGSPQQYGAEFAGLSADLRTELERTGATYRPYNYVSDGSYGVSWHTEAYVRQLAAQVSEGVLSLVESRERGLEDHQDVYVFRRGPATS